MLKQHLDKQVKIAAWQLVVSAMPIIGIIIMLTTAISGAHGFDNHDSLHFTTGVGLFVGGAMIFIGFIASLVLWIIGMVNASRIQSMTSDAVALLILSIFTFWIGHLIAAIVTRNNLKDASPEAPKSSFEKQLKQSFVNGVITSHEYEAKLREYNRK